MGHRDNVHTLVETGDSHGMRPMEEACEGGHVDVCELLAAHGARVYIPPSDLTGVGVSTMHAACAGGHAHMCEWLLNHGAPSGSINDASALNGKSPYAYACMRENLSLCKWLDARGAVLDPTDPLPICCAAGRGDVAMIEWLCSKGLEGVVNMPDPDSDGDTAMHMASEGLYIDAAQCLLDHGAQSSVTQRNAFNQTPLHKCCSEAEAPAMETDEQEGMNRRVERMVEWLCENGARQCISEPDIDGITPLHCACIAGAVDVCDVLHAQGAVDTVSGSRGWGKVSQEAPFHAFGRQPRQIPLASQLWVVRRFEHDLSANTVAVAFHRCLESRHTSWEYDADMLRMLRRKGPGVVAEALPPTASEALVETAARVGVVHSLLQGHPRLVAVVNGAVRRRRVFVGAFLFGCRRSSGSTRLWRIGSQHMMAGFRREVGEYCGVVVDTQEWGRVIEMRKCIV